MTSQDKIAIWTDFKTKDLDILISSFNTIYESTVTVTQTLSNDDAIATYAINCGDATVAIPFSELLVKEFKQNKHSDQICLGKTTISADGITITLIAYLKDSIDDTLFVMSQKQSPVFYINSGIEDMLFQAEGQILQIGITTNVNLGLQSSDTALVIKSGPDASSSTLTTVVATKETKNHVAWLHLGANETNAMKSITITYTDTINNSAKTITLTQKA